MESKRSNLPLYFLLLTFLLPVIISSICLKYKDELGFTLTAKGKLVAPTEKFELKDNEQFEFAKKWHLLYIGASECDSVCLQQKKDLAAIHILLGPKNSRVSLAQIDPAKVKNNLELGHTIIVSPHGEYIFDYEPKIGAKDILSDLKKLLKYSKG